MTAILCTRKKDALVPKAFYVFFICTTVILAVVAVASILNPYAGIATGNGYFLPLWSLAVQLLIIGSSIIGWILLLATKKEKRKGTVS